MRRAPSKNQDGAAQRLTPRRRLQLLIASGAVAAVAVTWGGFAAMGTLTTSDAEALSAPATSSAAASPASGGTADATDTTSSGSSPAASESPAGVPTPSVGVTPPPQGAGQHEGHGPGGGSSAGLLGSNLPGAPLTGEEPAAASASAPRPGAQQELSLEAAAAQPVPAAADTGASGPAGGGDRTAGLTPRAPIDPAEVTGGGLAALGGCLSEYGTNGQCLPVVPPSMAEHAQLMAESGISLDTMHHPWSCTEVRQLFADGLTIRQAGVDPQKLDTNGDGTACGIDD